jgi:hypothetical protein
VSRVVRGEVFGREAIGWFARHLQSEETGAPEADAVFGIAVVQCLDRAEV